MWFRIGESHDVAFVPEALIDLPSRKTMPHLFDKGALVTHATIFRMFRAARCRHYKHQPVKLAYELMKQTGYFVSSKARRVARRLV